MSTRLHQIYTSNSPQVRNFSHDSTLPKRAETYFDAMHYLSPPRTLLIHLPRFYVVGQPPPGTICAPILPVCIYSCRPDINSKPYSFIDVQQGRVILIPDDLQIEVPLSDERGKNGPRDFKVTPDGYTDDAFDCSVAIGKVFNPQSQISATLIGHILPKDIGNQLDGILRDLKKNGWVGSRGIFSPRVDSFCTEREDLETARRLWDNFFLETETIERTVDDGGVRAITTQRGWYMQTDTFKIQEPWSQIRVKRAG